MLYKLFFIGFFSIFTLIIGPKMSAQGSDNLAEIKKPIMDYFSGTYEANAEKIRGAFHPKAMIAGFFDGKYVEWTLDEFVKRITSQQSAKENNEPFAKKILSYEKAGEIAYVKAYAPAFGHEFIDIISLIKTSEGWKIRHKQFTNNNK